MNLSKDQIEILFDFTRKKYVHFYDLQVEIVDHLAAAIEDKITENKHLSFEEALEEVYKGFGIFGFAHVVREKEKQIDKQAFRMLWREVLLLFTWPGILLSALILISLISLSKIFSLGTLINITGSICLLAAIVLFIKLINAPKPKKKLRMMNIYSPSSVFFPYIYLQFYIYIYVVNTYISASYFIIFTFIIFIHFISSYRVNVRIRTNAMNLYPEAFAMD